MPTALRPTYRFHMGLPGRSYGLTIAAQLGLPEGVLDEARALLDPETMQVDDSTGEHPGASARRRWRRARLLTADQQAAGELRAELKERLARIADEREQVLSLPLRPRRKACAGRGAPGAAPRRAGRAGGDSGSPRADDGSGTGACGRCRAGGGAAGARQVAAADPAALTVGDRVRVRRLEYRWADVWRRRASAAKSRCSWEPSAPACRLLTSCLPPATTRSKRAGAGIGRAPGRRAGPAPGGPTGDDGIRRARPARGGGAGGGRALPR